MNGLPGDFAPRRAGAEVGAFLKITVTNEGLYRVDQPALVAAGLDPNDLSGAQIRLYCATQEVAVFVSNAGLWTAVDYLVFFGKPYCGIDSDANVYWLGIGGTGKRMETRSVAPIPALPDRQRCAWRSTYRRYTFLQDKYRPEDEGFDHWFINILNDRREIVIPIASDRVVASEPARLTVVLYGYSSSVKRPDHCTRVLFNDQEVANFKYDGQQARTGTCVVAGTLLRNVNRVWLRQIPLRNLTADQAYLREVRLDYTRKLWVTSGALIFPGQAGTNNYRVKGFSGPAVPWVLDVTEPDSPVRLTHSAMISVDGQYALRFGDAASAARRYAVCHPSRLRTPAKIQSVTFPGLDSTALQADYLIICPSGFRVQAARLAARRILQGLTVKVVMVPDIYNEFGYGVEDAAAIKQFLGYAYHHWQEPAPRYVLFAGSGSYDPKGYMLAERGIQSLQQVERIPVRMGPSRNGWACLEGWFVQVDGGDKLADMALGRLPCYSVAVLKNQVDKILAFEKVGPYNKLRKTALLVADDSDRSLNSKAACETVRKTILGPARFWSTTAYSDDIGEALTGQTTIESFYSGEQLVLYFGHGAVNRWGRDIFTAADAEVLQNTHFPIVIMMACRNGAFQNPLKGPCMAEALLNGPYGASACIGNTAVSYGSSCQMFTQGFMTAMVAERASRIGDGFLSGLDALNTYNPHTQELLYFNLFADPAMVVNPL